MTDHVGEQIGSYRLLRLLGHGGFANVYLGEHVYLKKQVAIKLLRMTLVGNSLEDFLKEARIVANLKHPNIVSVLDFGVQANIPYLVMSYAPNGTLRQRYPLGTPLPLDRIVHYVNQIADALQYAHNLRLVHRDIKPENMLLADENKVLLSDFGIASVVQSSRHQSLVEIVGTVAYMSPEQLQGRPQPASDQYSLGILVYEWLSGRRPFEGGFTELCTQQMFATPPSLNGKVPPIPFPVQEVMLKVLAKDPNQRFSSVRAFASALADAARRQAAAQIVLSPPVIPPAVIGQVGTNHAALPGQSFETTESVSSPPPATRHFQAQQTARRRISRRTAIAALGGLIILGGSAAGLVEYLGQNTHSSIQAKPQIGTLLYTYHGHRDYIAAVAWAPKATRIASASADQTVQVWDAFTGHNAFTYSSHTDVVSSLTWSPDGWCIASGSYDETAQVWDADNGSYMLTYQGHSSGLTSIAWSPVGEHVASASFDKTVQVWDAFTGHVYTIYRKHSAAVYAVTWSPDGKYIASAGADRTVQVWDASTGNTLFIYTHHSNTVAAIAWSPDGTRIVSAGYDKTVQVWDATTGNTLFIYRGHPDYVNAVAWSPDSKRVASGSGDTTVQEWDTITGKHLYTYRGHSAYVNAVSWNPSSPYIASGGTDSIVQVWRAE